MRFWCAKAISHLRLREETHCHCQRTLSFGHGRPGECFNIPCVATSLLSTEPITRKPRNSIFGLVSHLNSPLHIGVPRGGGNEMPQNGHLNGLMLGVKKDIFGLRKWNFLAFLVFGSVEGGEGFNIPCAQKLSHFHRRFKNLILTMPCANFTATSFQLNYSPHRQDYRPDFYCFSN